MCRKCGKNFKAFLSVDSRQLLRNSCSDQGFTLIELSIVLVIIGLIVGGVLVGRDLIAAAAVRAQISQIEKYQQAVNVFRGKYGYLPGDIPPSEAQNFGFVQRAGVRARGDGNTSIEGLTYSNANFYGWYQAGETLLFWRDLYEAGLLANKFSVVQDTSFGTLSGETTLDAYLPRAALGDAARVYVFSTFFYTYTYAGQGMLGNYFALTNLSSIRYDGLLFGTDGAVSVKAAHALDTKTDDGKPTKGTIQAWYPAANGTTSPGFATSSSVSDSTTCYETTTNNYSIQVNNGNGLNCGLSFKFQ